MRVSAAQLRRQSEKSHDRIAGADPWVDSPGNPAIMGPSGPVDRGSAFPPFEWLCLNSHHHSDIAKAEKADDGLTEGRANDDRCFRIA